MLKYLKRILFVVLALAIFDLLLAIGYAHLVKRCHKEGPITKADCIIVLFHDFEGKNGITDESVRRCRYALDLFLRGEVSAIVCSGGAKRGRVIPGAALMAQWLSERGVPQNALYIEANSCDSISNIRNSGKMLSRLGYRSALMVSSAMHLTRVAFLLSRETTSKEIAIHFAPYPDDKVRPRPELFTLIAQANYEWISYGLYLLLPKRIYNQVLTYLRGCRPDG